jgi:chromosome partitioning protein
MKVIAIANGKGGVGKTTLSSHIGVNLTKRGYYTVLLDTDPLACLQEWWEEREADDLPLMSIGIEALAGSLPALREAGVDYLIIDTPGFISSDINSVLELADLVVIASKASPLDLRATRKSLTWLKNCSVPMVFVLNEVRKRTVIESQSIIALSQCGKVAPVIHYKNDFVVSMTNGLTVEEVDPTNPGALEIDSLAEYLLGELGVEAIKPVVRDLGTSPKAQGLKGVGKPSGTPTLKVVSKR